MPAIIIMIISTRSIVALCAVLTTVVLVGDRLNRVEGQQVPGAGFAAIPGVTGRQDIFGPYEPVRSWPRPMSDSLLNHENGRIQKFRPRPGANPAFLVGKPWKGVW